MQIGVNSSTRPEKIPAMNYEGESQGFSFRLPDRPPAGMRKLRNAISPGLQKKSSHLIIRVARWSEIIANFLNVIKLMVTPDTRKITYLAILGVMLMNRFKMVYIRT